MLLPQQGAESHAGLRQSPHAIRPNERHVERHLGGGGCADHRGCARHGNGRRTGGVGRRFARQIHAAGAAGATGAAGKLMPPPPGVMSPSSPPGTENPRADEGPLDNEFLQPGQTRARTRTYHQATATAGPADHALSNQHPPNSRPSLPTCHASELSEPATYQEGTGLEYSTNWSYAIDQELSGFQWAGTFGVA